MTLPQLADIRAERSRRSLRYYLEHVLWPVLEPSTPFVPGWHLDAICNHAQAVVRGDINNLLITIAPRHTKSLCISVALPTWTWLSEPGLRFLFASYSADLSTEHAVLSRRVIESALYQEIIGDGWKLTSDQNVKTHYENDRRGYRISTTVRGAATGKGGDVLVTDDPHNIKEVESDKRRKEVIGWDRDVWSTRHNNPRNKRSIAVMQRSHEKDLAGYKIATEKNLTHLNLPTEFEPKRRCRIAVTGWEDPRSEEGELLNPERTGPVQVDEIKDKLGEITFSCQHQQDPVNRKGVYFKRKKLRVVSWIELRDVLALAGCAVSKDSAPSDVEHQDTRGWDFAATSDAESDDPDYTVGLRLRRYFTPNPETDVYVAIDRVGDRWDPGDGDAEMKSVATADGPYVRQREETDPGQAGKRCIAGHALLLHQLDYAGVSLGNKNKVQRATPLIRCVDSGRFYILATGDEDRDDWISPYREQMARFNKAPHDDDVDATSCAYNDLSNVEVDQPSVAVANWG